MRHPTLLIAAWAVAFAAYATKSFSDFKGVWSSDTAEAVLTDSICIFYYQADSTMQAKLEIPNAGIARKTVFKKGGKTTTSDTDALEISLEGGVLTIDGYPLKKVENIRIVAPHEMPKCNSRLDVGTSLQQWRLGAGYGVNDEMVYCEINTNRHMFVYMVSPNMVYIRAAATRNCNDGTLFFQNIRMMKNSNTGEFTMEIIPDNYRVTRNDLEIDHTKFQPDKCTFSPDGGIYWSFISSEPDLILLNGCGETYEVKRPAPDSEMEYIEYIPYSTDSSLFLSPTK